VRRSLELVILPRINHQLGGAPQTLQRQM
jgi:hypothetical protein